MLDVVTKFLILFSFCLRFAKKDATKAQQQFFLQSLDENGEPELDGLDNSFAEQIIKHAQAQAEKDGTEELLFEMDPVLLKLFDSAEAVKEYPKFFKLVRKDESRGTSSFKFKKHTCRRTFDKGDPEFVRFLVSVFVFAFVCLTLDVFYKR